MARAAIYADSVQNGPEVVDELVEILFDEIEVSKTLRMSRLSLSLKPSVLLWSVRLLWLLDNEDAVGDSNILRISSLIWSVIVTDDFQSDSQISQPNQMRGADSRPATLSVVVSN